MSNETVNNAKKIALEEKMRDSMIEGTIEQKMSVFRMEAVNLGIPEGEFLQMVEVCKKKAEEANNIKNYMKKKGIIYLIITAIIILIIWLLHIGWGWKLLFSLLTIIAIVFVISIIYKSKKK